MSAVPPVRRIVTPAPLILRRGSEADIAYDGSLDGDLSTGAGLPSPPPTTDGQRSFSGAQQYLNVKPPGSAGLLRPPIQIRRSSSWSSAKQESRSATTSPTGARARKATLTRRQPLPTALLSAELLAKLNAWIECIAIVNFDIDAGPGASTQLFRIGVSTDDGRTRTRQLLSPCIIFSARETYNCICRRPTR